MITLSDLTQAFKNASESDREDFLNVLIPAFEAKVTKIIETVLNESFDQKLANSDFHPIQRVFELETITGLNNFKSSDEEDEDKEPTVLSRIHTLEDKLDNIKAGTAEKSSVEIKLKSKTGRRAMALIKALMASKKGHLTRSQIRDTLSDEKDEELGDARITDDSSNPRRDIIDAINTAKKLCSKVMPDKKGYGRHEWRLVLRS